MFPPFPVNYLKGRAAPQNSFVSNKVVVSIPTASTINRVDSVAIALSSADFRVAKAGFWSKVGPSLDQKRKRPTPCELAFFIPD